MIQDLRTAERARIAAMSDEEFQDYVNNRVQVLPPTAEERAQQLSERDMTIEELGQRERDTERYGSPEAGQRVRDALFDESLSKTEDSERGNRYYQQEGLGLKDYAQSVQDVGDMIGYIPTPPTRAVGTAMYVAGAGARGDLIEAAGGVLGAGAGKLSGKAAAEFLKRRRALSVAKDAATKSAADIGTSEAVEKTGESLSDK